MKVRSLSVLINTFVDKLPNSVARDGRIHGQFKQIGADTGRMSSAEPNLQNIPSHAVDIRHMFRATPESMEKLDPTGVTEDEITFTVPRWYSVTVNSSPVEASNVHEGDELSILDNNVSVTMRVTSVDEVDENIKITVKRNS